MTKTDTIKLIRETLTPREAKEVLRDIFRSKINFHNIKNWSSEERYGKPDQHADERAEELRYNWKQIEQMLEEAELLGKNVTIDAPVRIVMSDN
jgi:hypothetical protein